MNKRFKILIYGLLITIIIIGALQYFFPRDDCQPYLYGGHHMFGGSIYPIGMIGMVVFWVLVVMIVMSFFNKDKERHIDSLKERLSRGDITIDEYERIKDKINR
ncbi:hypothetical protein HF295_02135 [Hujiaoplasma nucleasis]|uniref:SHOCT domain-containing protein n=1 Tax=Hujiaoplasma nucleasis TaxID=2725268 RepID=A0A7L6N0D9_9MOLU|nr:hypothetical protein [Hujiaoplasma nucleasis]QLY39720.1 hypothetical protein HF295_02135 [Hujiaoplasma nucleasis]